MEKYEEVKKFYPWEKIKANFPNSDFAKDGTLYRLLVLKGYIIEDGNLLSRIKNILKRNVLKLLYHNTSNLERRVAEELVQIIDTTERNAGRPPLKVSYKIYPEGIMVCITYGRQAKKNGSARKHPLTSQY